MPPVVAAVAQIAAATIFSANVVIAFISRVVFSTAISALINKSQSPETGPVGLSPRDITTRSALEFRKIGYGLSVVSGPLAYNNTAGNNNKDLWYVIPLLHGRSEAITALWLDDERIPVADIDWTPGSGAGSGSGTGAVSTSLWVGEDSTTALWCWWALGYDAQPVISALDSAFDDITTDFRLRGVTYGVVRLRYTKKTEKVWENGPPRNIKFEVQARLVYDPRLDSTNGGSGTHRYTDSSTWEYSTNPILCTIDYLTQFVGADPATAIRWSDVADAADDCDPDAIIPPASPVTNETRFTANGTVSLGSDHIDNLEAILSSCVGKLSHPSDQWRIRSSVWAASSDSFDEDDLIESFAIQGSRPASSRWNVVRGVFFDPDRNYQPVEFPHVTDSTYVTRDGGDEIPKDIELPFTNSRYMAQRIAYRVLHQGNRQVTTEWALNPIATNVVPGQTVDLTHSAPVWSAKDFGVLKWKPRPDGGFSLGLMEDESGNYDDPVVVDYDVASDDTITVPSASVPPTEDLAAVGVPVGIKLTWTRPPRDQYDFIDIYASTDDDWSNAALIGSIRGQTYTHNLEANEVRYYWTRARFASDESDRDPDSDTSTVTATAASGAPGLVSLPVQFKSEAIGTLPQTASIVFKSTGVVELDGFTDLNWWNNAPVTDVGDGYQVRCSALLSGTFDTQEAAVGTWVTIDGDRTWTMTRTVMEGSGSDAVSATFQIRPLNEDSTILAEGTASIEAADA